MPNYYDIQTKLKDAKILQNYNSLFTCTLEKIEMLSIICC